MSTHPPSPSYVPGPIWPPDWSQFIPDAIGAVAIGFIIGLFLWRFERGAEARRARAEAEARWRVARAGLGSQMGPLRYRFIDRAADQYVRTWQPFLAALDPQVPVWAQASPANEELQLASGLMSNLPALGREVESLSAAIGQVLIERGYAARGTESRAASYCLVMLLAEVDGTEHENATTYFAARNLRGEWALWLEEVRSDPLVARLVSVVHERKRRVDVAWDVLGRVLMNAT